MRPERIYHVTTSEWWHQFSSSEPYVTETLREEGFIHCSMREQVAGVLERYYKDKKGLLLLHIDPALLAAELKYELATNDLYFPHVYGAINREAIIEVETLKN